MAQKRMKDGDTGMDVDQEGAASSQSHQEGAAAAQAHYVHNGKKICANKYYCDYCNRMIHETEDYYNRWVVHETRVRGVL